MFRLYSTLPLILLLTLASCAWGPHHDQYRCCYAHLEEPIQVTPMEETDYFLVMLTNARHLDYSDSQYFLRTCAKHPSDGSKNGDVGHAWLVLQGYHEGKKLVIEGGHTGETGETQSKYFEGVMNNVSYGYPDPTSEQRKNPRYEPDPLRYLWKPQYDGYFQKGNGDHRPTFAAKMDLTQEQFERLVEFIKPDNYDYREYSISCRQCSTFLAAVAEEIGFYLEHQVILYFDDTLTVAGDEYHL